MLSRFSAPTPRPRRGGALTLFLLILATGVCGPPAGAWEFGEHKEIGDAAFRAVTARLVQDDYYPSAEALDAFLRSDLKMSCGEQDRTCYFDALTHLPNEATYGTMNALSGDHVDNPLLLEDGLQERTSVVNQTVALQAEYFEKFRNAAPNLQLFGLDYWYGLLAYVNLSHFWDYGRSLQEHIEDFDPANVKMLWEPKHVDKVFKRTNTHLLDRYLTLHAFAISLAEKAGGEYRAGNPEAGATYLYYAILFNGFADHFLEDMFAAGHTVVKRTIAGSLINNSGLHNFYNKIGVRVADLQGDIWKTAGDDHLNTPAETWRGADSYLALRQPEGGSCVGAFDVEKKDNVTPTYCRVEQAVAESLWEVWTAFENARRGDASSILDRMPPKEGSRVLQELKSLPVLSMAPLAREQNARAREYVKLFPVLTMIPIPFGTTDLKGLGVPPQEIPEMLTATQLLPNRDFIRTRVANSFTFLWGTDFVENTSTNLGARIGLGGFLYSYHDVPDKTGTADQWLGWTLSYIGGISRPEKGNPGFSRIKLGPQYNLDIWVSPKRYLGIYSYLELGTDIRNGTVSFLFAPSVGLQLGPLLGWDNYVLPDYVRIPLQLILPVKGCVTYNMTSDGIYEPSFAVEVDLVF